MIVLATILSGLSLLMSALFLVRLKYPLGVRALMPRLIAAALSPVWAIVGAVGAVIGWIYQAPWAIPMGGLGAGMMTWYVWRCTRDHKRFEKAFGPNWLDQISPEQARHMLQRRWTWPFGMKASLELSCERDIPFWTVPGTDRQLLCDLWRPANGSVSGLVFIYFHGGGWTHGDKERSTIKKW